MVMSNCDKKGTQILIEENEEMTNFKIYEKKNNEMLLLAEFSTPEEVEEFFKKMEIDRPDEDTASGQYLFFLLKGRYKKTCINSLYALLFLILEGGIFYVYVLFPMPRSCWW